jgi:aspartyl-tRNA(Asn)/glutamyl-tRNA(Gln) amidotransferase subunit A
MKKELHKKIQSVEKTSEEICREYLNTIKEKDGEINAFIEVYDEAEVLEQAKIVDQKVKAGEEIGLLEGIPCALKDVINIQGKITTAASKMLENYVAPEDATIVKMLKKEGVIFVGKANLDEFTMGASGENSAFGSTKNPHDTTRVPGGSSSGSVAAVAADMVPWSVGTDTGGSIRQPSGFCGTVGLRGTYGRVSRRGVFPMATSYDQPTPVAQTVEDVAIIFKAIAGQDKQDNTTIAESKIDGKLEDLDVELKGMKIGYVKEFFETEGLDEDVRDLVQERIDWAKEQGAEIVEIELPNFKYSLATYYMMITAEISSNMARIDGIRCGFNGANDITTPQNSRSSNFDPLYTGGGVNLLDVYNKSRSMTLGEEVQRRIILGTYVLSAGYYDAYYKKAQAVRELIKGDLKKAFEKVDCIIAPTSPTPAFKLGDKSDDPLAMYLADIYTVTANVAQIPAISIPAGTVKREEVELPVGMQLLGKWWDDWKLLGIAKQFEI